VQNADAVIYLGDADAPEAASRWSRAGSAAGSPSHFSNNFKKINNADNSERTSANAVESPFHGPELDTTAVLALVFAADVAVVW
jgi:hypothetical protein